MLIVLSQRIDTASNYEDKVFSLYHYPKVYANQIHEGDLFIYYQGDSQVKDRRYYYGYGTIGKITSDGGNNYYAELLNVIAFEKKVPIYHPNGGYIEQIGFESVRKKPAWQRSIRKISEPAFWFILNEGLGEAAAEQLMMNPSQPLMSERQCKEDIEEETKTDYVVQKEGSVRLVYTTRYERNPKLRAQAVRYHGTSCMACGFNFHEKYGERGKQYIEVHHIKPLAESKEEMEVDPKTDLIVVCSNCHRMIHRKKNEVLSLEELREIIRTAVL